MTPSATPSVSDVVVPFHPIPAPPASTPYLPLATSPTESTPRRPQTPWTEIAPTGSSIFSLRSMKNTASITTTPAMSPRIAATHGSTNAHGAVMITRPASMPLAIMAGSGLPVRFQIHNIEMNPPNAAASPVLSATTPICGSLDAKVDAALKPNQPNRRINVPRSAIGM